MFKTKKLFQNVVLGLSMASAANSFAGEAFGNPYMAVAPITSSQAQVVAYRPAAPNALSGAANVYLDGEFHAALLPGGYSTLCVAAGAHNLTAALNDAPQYKGKDAKAGWFTLAGGNTYFLRVDADSSKAPQFVKREGAERELAGTRQQIQALSRASSAQTCDSLMARASASQ